MKMRAPLLGMVAVLAACGGEEPIGVNNVSPSGSVGGVLLDAATMKPMAGVSVNVVAGAFQFPDSPAVTDASGRFAIDKVPAGDILVQIKAPATHQSVSIAAVLPNAAGDFPLANATLSLGPIGLLPIAAEETAFRVQLVTAEGAPAANVKVHLRTQVAWVDLSSGEPAGKGAAFVEAVSPGSGVVRFTGMPDVVRVAGMVGPGSTSVSDAVRVIIPPFDRDKDGVLDFCGKDQTFSLLKLNGAVPTIVLTAAPTTALQVMASNIAALAGKPTGNRVLPATAGPLMVTFNMPIISAQTEISVFDERGALLPQVVTKKAVSANLLTVNFEQLEAGSEYNINIRTIANVEGNRIEGYFGAPVFTPVKQGKVTVASLARDKSNPNRVMVTFSEPIGLGIPGQGLTGAYSVLFFGADLNGSGVVGDGPGERGFPTSAAGMYIDEALPPGPAGRSGLSRYWFFDLPYDSGGPLPAGTSFDFGFSRVGAGTVQRADGSAVPDIGGQQVPAGP